MSGDELSGDDKVLDLVGSIYDAALDARLWPDVLDRIGDAVGGPEVIFGVYDPATGLSNLLAPRIDPVLVGSLMDWAPRNPLLPLGVGQAPGKVFTCGDFITQDEFTSTAFYQEWWRPAGYDTEPLTTNVLVDGAASGIFTSHGLLRRSSFDSAQKRLFAALAQHLVRAVALQRRLFQAGIASENALSAFDSLQQGVVLVDAQARPLFVNRVAAALLDARDGLRLDTGALFASDASEGRLLRGLIAACATEAMTATGSGGEVALRREAGRASLDVLVTPVRRDIAMAPASWIPSPRPVAIVLISDPETETGARIASLRERFGFTRAEAALALEIVKGDGRQAAADRLGITVGTARSHLSSIFDKTGVRRQAELVHLLLQK